MMENQNKESENLKNLRSIINRFNKKTKQVAKAVTLAGLVAAGSPLVTSCTMPNTPAPIERENLIPADPYDIDFGNHAYTFHNFIGSKPDIITSTAEEDIARYRKMAVSYLQEHFDNFNQSVADRPGVKRYFARFNCDFSSLPENKTNHHQREFTETEKIDSYINQIDSICTPIFVDMIEHTNSAEHREALILIMRTMANEARKAGSPANYNLENYRQEREAVASQWAQNDFLKTIPYEQDIDLYKSRRIADRLFTLQSEIKSNLQKESLLESLKTKDLQNLTELVLLGSSLSAAHDYTTTFTKHNNCTVNLQFIAAMEEANTLLNAKEQSKSSQFDTELSL